MKRTSKPDRVERVCDTIRMIVSAIVMTFAVGVAGAWLVVLTDRAPAVCRAGSVAALFTDCEVVQ